MEEEYTEEEKEYTEEEVMDIIMEALYDNASFGDARIKTFEESGVMTNDKGLYIEMGEQKIYITVQVQ
jgi:hypothetical protein